MAKTATVQIRLDHELKSKVDGVFQKLVKISELENAYISIELITQILYLTDL